MLGIFLYLMVEYSKVKLQSLNLGTLVMNNKGKLGEIIMNRLQNHLGQQQLLDRMNVALEDADSSRSIHS